MPKFTVGQVEPKRKETMYEKFKKQLKKEAISVAQNPVGATSDILNRGVVAQTLGAPVDIMNMGLRGIQGITGLPVASQQPFMGSDYINKQFENMGITSGTQRPILETAAGMLAPAIPRMIAPSQARQTKDLPIGQPYETIVPNPAKQVDELARKLINESSPFYTPTAKPMPKHLDASKLPADPNMDTLEDIILRAKLFGYKKDKK